MNKLGSAKFYTLFTGIVLFGMGFLGFAFPSLFNISDGYLFFSLVLGFWGIVVGIKKP